MGARILLVDDEPDLVQALSVRLSAAGYVCDAAGNGREALERIAQHRPDLIILDLLMPEVSGYEVCRRLKADPQLAEIPLIVLTAVPEKAVQQNAVWLGAQSILHKPFDSDILLQTVREVLHGPGEGVSAYG